MKHLAVAMSAILSAALPIQAAIKTQTVAYRQDNTVLKGYLAYDDAVQGKRPGVVVFPEWWGMVEYPKHRAEQLAGLGYVALVADMYGDGAGTDQFQQASAWATALRGNLGIMRARAAAALEQLKGQPQVDPAKTAAIGYCLGGQVALELARSGADLGGVVSFHGGLTTTQPAAANSVKAKILVQTGGIDPNVPDKDVVAFMDEMRKAGADWQVNVYSGAMHSFTNPAAKMPAQGVAYNAEADRRSWDSMKQFFAEDVFGQGQSSAGTPATP